MKEKPDEIKPTQRNESLISETYTNLYKHRKQNTGFFLELDLEFSLNLTNQSSIFILERRLFSRRQLDVSKSRSIL